MIRRTPVRPRHRSTRRLPRPFPLALAVLVLFAASCSDAHTAAQKLYADPGSNPNVLVILAPGDLTPSLEALGSAFTLAHPGKSLYFLSEVMTAIRGYRGRPPGRELDDAGRILPSNATPHLWIDRPLSFVLLPRTKKTYGPPLEYGSEILQFVVPAGNPFGVKDLSVFAGEGPRAGLCVPVTPCGRASLSVLAANKITPARNRHAARRQDAGRRGLEREGRGRPRHVDRGGPVSGRRHGAPLHRRARASRLPDPAIERRSDGTGVRDMGRHVPASEGDPGLAGPAAASGVGHVTDHAWGAAPSTVVCITGMHRSGTSFASRTLSLLGVSLGDRDRLMPPGPDNPAGYWENQSIKEFDDELLSHLGGAWDFPPVLRIGWHLEPDLEPFRDQAAAHPVRGVRRGTGSLAADRLQGSTRLAAAAVLAHGPAHHRHDRAGARSREVARSLGVRRYKVGPTQAAVLWMQYLFAATANDPDHLLLRHQDFFEDLDTTLDRVADHIGIDRPGTEVRAAVRADLDPSLRHHHDLPGDDEALDPLMRLAEQIWNDGDVDFGVVPPPVAAAMADGWLRGPLDSDALTKARADVITLKERVKRLNGTSAERAGDGVTDLPTAAGAEATLAPTSPPAHQVDGRDGRAGVPYWWSLPSSSSTRPRPTGWPSSSRPRPVTSSASSRPWPRSRQGRALVPMPSGAPCSRSTRPSRRTS